MTATAPTDLQMPDRPYIGLRPFDRGESVLFFGVASTSKRSSKSWTPTAFWRWWESPAPESLRWRAGRAAPCAGTRPDATGP